MVSAVWPGRNWKLMEVKDVEVMWLAGQEVGLEHWLVFQLLVVTTGSQEDLSEHFACARCLFWQEGSGVKRGRAKPLTCWTWCCQSRRSLTSPLVPASAPHVKVSWYEWPIMQPLLILMVLLWISQWTKSLNIGWQTVTAEERKLWSKGRFWVRKLGE